MWEKIISGFSRFVGGEGLTPEKFLVVLIFASFLLGVVWLYGRFYWTSNLQGVGRPPESIVVQRAKNIILSGFIGVGIIFGVFLILIIF